MLYVVSARKVNGATVDITLNGSTHRIGKKTVQPVLSQLGKGAARRVRKTLRSLGLARYAGVSRA